LKQFHDRGTEVSTSSKSVAQNNDRNFVISPGFSTDRKTQREKQKAFDIFVVLYY